MVGFDWRAKMSDYEAKRVEGGNLCALCGHWTPNSQRKTDNHMCAAKKELMAWHKERKS